MSQLAIRPAKESDIAWILARLSQQDRDSLEAQEAGNLEVAFRRSMRESRPSAFTACETVGPLSRCFENPAAMFGIAPVVLPADPRRVGQVWCVGTQSLRDRLAREFAKGSRRWLDLQMSQYDVLYNMEDARADSHIRWLKFCGFEMLKRVPYGPKSLPFLQFARFA